MKKTSLLKFAALSTAFFFFMGSSNAQTKLWGVGAAAGQADAEFQNNFVQSTTAGSYSPTAWTALAVSEDGGNTQPGNAYWVRNLTGLSQGGYASNMSVATSASQANGVALFDSDFLDNAGTAGAFGTGASPAAHVGELISPRIDLTGATDSALVVQFYSYYRPFTLNELTVSLSVDDGVSWTTVDIAALQPTSTNNSTQGIVRALFPTITSGVTILDQCRLKFRFNGRYYYSIIDDIVIEMAPEYDMAIGQPDGGAPTYFSVGNIIRMGHNNYIPQVNIYANDLSEWYWGAKIINNGWKDMTLADAPMLVTRVDFTDPLTGNTTPGVYRDTMMMPGTDTIFSNDKNGIALVEQMNDIAFTNIYGEGRYDVVYWVEHSNQDGNPANDTIEHSFNVTREGGSNSHYLSKARLANADGRVFAGSQIFPGGSPHSAFEYGSLYYFPRGASDSISIDSVDFRYYVPNNFSGAATQTLFCNIYSFVDGSNGGAANGFITGDELTQIGIAPVSLTGLGSTVANGDYGLAVIDGFVDAATGGPMAAFADGGFYYVSILTQPSLTGGVATFQFNDVPIHGVDRLNYAMNIGTTSTTVPFAPSTLKVVDPAGSESWFAGFTGFDEVPSLGLHLGSSRILSTSTPVNPITEAQMNLYPNPTNDILNISVAFGEREDAQYIITDVSGRVVYLQRSEQVTEEVQVVDVQNLSAGVYFVTVETDKGVTTKRFIKK